MAALRRGQLLGPVGILLLVSVTTTAAGATGSGRGSVHSPHRAGTVIGHGSPGGCTSAAVVKAVAGGAHIAFRCGPAPVTIVMKQTAKVVNTSHRIVIDGGGLVTLSGAGKRRILYMNTCDPAQTYTTSHCDDQRWPQLAVKDISFVDGNAPGRQTADGIYGGGAMFVRGGGLTVTGSTFLHNRCHATGPDLGGAAIRALSQYRGQPVEISHDVFRAGRCSNGGAVSSIGVSWQIAHTRMTNNTAVGSGANPAQHGTPGGGSGGAIYTDGNTYDVRIRHSVIADNHANEGGGAIFFVSNDHTGKLFITGSTLHHNPNDGFFTAGYPGIFFLGAGKPHVSKSSTIN
jgi:hypothetical protein